MDNSVTFYIATAIAEEIGEEHLPSLQKIISEKYDIAIEKNGLIRKN